MTAFNPSLTKLPQPWEIDVSRSPMHGVLFASLTLCAFVALWLCPVNLTLRLSLIVVVGLASAQCWRSIPRRLRLAWNTDDQWQLLQPKTKPFNGQLANGCYRSAQLIIIAIREKSGKVQRVAIWRDAISAADFSRIHVHLACYPNQEQTA